MVLPVGFEPTTYALEEHYSIQLSYGSMYVVTLMRLELNITTLKGLGPNL